MPTTYVYRGVHARHPMVEAARRGVIVPGDVSHWIQPEVTPEHNDGRRLADSPFTSWSYSLEEAERKAYDQGVGCVILRLGKDTPGPGEIWSWQDSPDEHHEDEVLLRGVRLDCEVIYGR